MTESNELRRRGIVERLLKANGEFRRLHRNHEQLESQLADIDRRPYLTGEEESERKRLQKQKLLEKDRMEALIREFHHGYVEKETESTVIEL